MERLVRGYNDLRVNHPNVWSSTIVTESVPNENAAHKLLKKDTYEYYRVSTLQQTVVPLSDTVKYEDILNEHGKEKYYESQHKYDKGLVKAHFEDYALQYCTSGGWWKDDNSKHNNQDDKNINGILNCWNNIKIFGFLSGNDKEAICTSICVFITDNWCLTSSGSLYSLGNRCSLIEILSKIKKIK